MMYKVGDRFRTTQAGRNDGWWGDIREVVAIGEHGRYMFRIITGSHAGEYTKNHPSEARIASLLAERDWVRDYPDSVRLAEGL